MGREWWYTQETDGASFFNLAGWRLSIRAIYVFVGEENGVSTFRFSP